MSFQRFVKVSNVAAGVASAGCISSQSAAAQNKATDEGTFITVDVAPAISEEVVPARQQQLKSSVRSRVCSVHPPVVEQDALLFSKRQESAVISKRQDAVVFSKQLTSAVQSQPRRLSKCPTRCSTTTQEVKKDEEAVASNRSNSVPKEVIRSQRSAVVSSKQVIKSTKVASMKEDSLDTTPRAEVGLIRSKKVSAVAPLLAVEIQTVPTSETMKQETVSSQRASRSVESSVQSTRSTKPSTDQIVGSKRRQVHSRYPPIITSRKPKALSKTPAPIDQLVSRTSPQSEITSQGKQSFQPDTAVVVVENKRPSKVHSVISQRNKDLEVNTTPASVECILHERRGAEGPKTATTTIRITESSRRRRSKSRKQRVTVNYTRNQSASKTPHVSDSVDVHSDSAVVSVSRNSRIPFLP